MHVGEDEDEGVSPGGELVNGDWGILKLNHDSKKFRRRNEANIL